MIWNYVFLEDNSGSAWVPSASGLGQIIINKSLKIQQKLCVSQQQQENN